MRYFLIEGAFLEIWMKYEWPEPSILEMGIYCKFIDRLWIWIKTIDCIGQNWKNWYLMSK